MPLLLHACATLLMFAGYGSATAQPQDPDMQATQTLWQLTQEEKLCFLHVFLDARLKTGGLPPDVVKGAGYVPGVPRLRSLL
jgi:hypothetical protein